MHLLRTKAVLSSVRGTSAWRTYGAGTAQIRIGYGSDKKVSVKRKNTKIDSKYAIYKFASFDDYCNFVKYLKNHNLSLSYKVAKNILLYLYKEDYYIVFDNINLKYSNIAKFNSAIIEFAKFISNSSLFICKLLENGEIIMNNNAIKTGIKYFK